MRNWCAGVLGITMLSAIIVSGEDRLKSQRKGRFSMENKKYARLVNGCKQLVQSNAASWNPPAQFSRRLCVEILNQLENIPKTHSTIKDFSTYSGALSPSEKSLPFPPMLPASPELPSDAIEKEPFNFGRENLQEPIERAGIFFLPSTDDSESDIGPGTYYTDALSPPDKNLPFPSMLPASPKLPSDAIEKGPFNFGRENSQEPIERAGIFFLPMTDDTKSIIGPGGPEPFWFPSSWESLPGKPRMIKVSVVFPNPSDGASVKVGVMPDMTISDALTQAEIRNGVFSTKYKYVADKGCFKISKLGDYRFCNWITTVFDENNNKLTEENCIPRKDQMILRPGYEVEIKCEQIAKEE